MSLLFDCVVGPSPRIHEQQRQGLEDQKEALRHRVQNRDATKDLEERHVGIQWSKETTALCVNSKGGEWKSNRQSSEKHHTTNDLRVVVGL